MKLALLPIALLASSVMAQTTEAPPKQDPPKVEAAKPEDVASVDAIIKSVYDVISGPAGKKRDWERMRSLFRPDARMIVSGKRPNGQMVQRVLTVEDYIKSSGPVLEERGFFESEIARKTEQFANIAHVFSTYQSKSKLEDEKPFARGINSIQLWNDGTRWWVLTIYWQSEDPANPLPEKYLKGG